MSAHQLARLLPLPEDELSQVLQYAATLSKPEAADHFRNLLGDSPEAVDFISSFNSRRQGPAAPASECVPKSTKGPKKKKKPALHTPAPRQVAHLGPAPGTAYSKKDLKDDYISRRSSPAAASSSGYASPVNPPQHKSATPPPPRPAPTAAGHLISDFPKPKTKPTPKSTPASHSSTPVPKAKVNISGGTAMHGAPTALSDLEHAIRTLEMSTNPTQATDLAARRCNCVATRHPLLVAAPNCLSCGKVICVKEGLGPCTSCGTPLLSSAEVQSMIRELRNERGREKMAADRDAHRRAEVSKKPAPFSKQRETTDAVSEAESKALEHRDRLLGFQSQNARRTTVRDEAADFDVSDAVAGTGGNIWASPEERARELKRQQKIMRETEWNARPDYEKRRQVVSIDLVGGKVVRKMAAIDRPESPVENEQTDVRDTALEQTTGNRRDAGGGTFSKNPLLGGLIKPVFDASKGKGPELEGRKTGASRSWKRVQDDLDNNEAVILDGGAYGGQGDIPSGLDEPACG
ncbi:Uu.00g054680.m01.CDS01 [Anthostomella pinea]|uniref:Uu.00g054680.m01.CDS01 n=1 Tax=Anthostomella pinea TaxID=933095 RepID=A0AAI8YPL7_9PEZI|nr:Uu.00g054680.m01.CDS01 [Anthostomella pinea]